MSLLVMKFGGTSVGNATAIAALAAITRDHLATWDHAVVVVSAMSGVTDLLLKGASTAAAGDAASYKRIAASLREKHAAALAELVPDGADAAATRGPIEQLIDEFELLCHSVGVLGEASPRAIDAISSLGERMSVRLVAAALRARGIAAEAIDATEFVITSPHFTSAVPIQPQTRERTRERLLPLLERGAVPVVTGFIGATESGATTTLGRGGSDYSGAIIGAALDADEVAIYTDVDGVMTTDPRLVPDARVIPAISFAEMGELAYFGAKVLHPRTIRPVVEHGIPLRIRNTFNAAHPGTLVVSAPEANGRAIKAVTAIKSMSMITVEGRGMIGVPGVAARTFGAVASVGANVLMISQASSEQSICFVVPFSASAAVVHSLEDGLANELARRDVDRIWARDDVVIVTAVGAGMRETPGVASQVFGTLAERHINVVAIAQGSSECSISVVVSSADADAAVRAIHALTI
ncbi:aspartate kinase [Kouleothrix sp.]|uniref:aspartate kinase n=1 Tax=Kouleothrix sp. TaxID=2779161 RepID=UPI0039188AB1